MSIIESVVSVLAPHECLGCHVEGHILCPACSETIQNIPPRCYLCKRWTENYQTCRTCRRRTPLHAVVTVSSYEGLAKELIHRLKFERAQAAAKAMASSVADVCGSMQNVIVTHVPTANARVRERGYDQAALIARALASRLGLPYAPLLRRSGDTRQVGEDRAIRKAQMHDVFYIRQAILQPKAHILLVDDVLTTGATCEAAAQVLRRAGVQRVSAAVFAVA